MRWNRSRDGSDRLSAAAMCSALVLAAPTSVERVSVRTNQRPQRCNTFNTGLPPPLGWVSPPPGPGHGMKCMMCIMGISEGRSFGCSRNSRNKEKPTRRQGNFPDTNGNFWTGDVSLESDCHQDVLMAAAWPWTQCKMV